MYMDIQDRILRRYNDARTTNIHIILPKTFMAGPSHMFNNLVFFSLNLNFLQIEKLGEGYDLNPRHLPY